MKKINILPIVLLVTMLLLIACVGETKEAYNASTQNHNSIPTIIEGVYDRNR